MPVIFSYFSILSFLYGVPHSLFCLIISQKSEHFLNFFASFYICFLRFFVISYYTISIYIMQCDKRYLFCNFGHSLLQHTFYNSTGFFRNGKSYLFAVSIYNISFSEGNNCIFNTFYGNFNISIFFKIN